MLDAIRSGLLRVAVAAVLAFAPLVSSAASDLDGDLGRNDSLVLSEPYPIAPGRTVAEIRLAERLERLGYRRVRDRPDEPGEFFWGHETFWFFRREHRLGGDRHPAALIGLDLRRTDGRIEGARRADGEPIRIDRGEARLEPETLSESLAADRATRVPVAFDELPDHVWRTVLAAEDSRFFDHRGVDARAIARAALANARRGKVAQGGSTITQQLVKGRDLSPTRSLGRKASEAIRALALEASYEKEQILEAYLNRVYFGHVRGLAVHGVGAAARAFFSKDASDLTLGESAVLAAMVQGPNRLSPVEHPERVRTRRDWVLARMAELGWADPEPIRRAQHEPVRATPEAPRSRAPVALLSWIRELARREAPGRMEHDRGIVVETTLDPWLQDLAERAVADHLAALRRGHRALRDAPLAAALVALDADTGAVRAYVGGDPGEREAGIDRARLAERQPGSTVKPFVVLEAFDDCGGHDPLHPASRVADEPLRIELDANRSWEPRNHDGEYRGLVGLREALAGSRNVPLVRVARFCGMDGVARTFEDVGLDLPSDRPPSFVLGAVETTPLRLAEAYTVFATPGRVLEAYPVARMERPSGRKLALRRTHGRRVASPSSAWLVRDLLVTAVASGTARAAGLDGIDVAAKTGTSSELRDAWLAGHAGALVTVVWVGLDDGSPLGLTGSAAAAPLWNSFMRDAVPARPPRDLDRPTSIEELWIDPRSGLLVRSHDPRAVRELFRGNATPPRDRFWRADAPVPVIR